MLDETKKIKWENNVITRLNEQSPKLFEEFNKVFVSGRIETELEYSHNVLWEKFYRIRVKVERASGKEDLVPVMVSEVLLGKNVMKEPITGKWTEIIGQFRSYNKEGEDGKRHLLLFLFVTDINIYEKKEELKETENTNLIYLDGYLCRPPLIRNTYSGKQITDFQIAVHRKFGKSDYIPCIAWNKTAQWTSKLEIGTRVSIYGRIQSRKYPIKDLEEEAYKEVYEISVMLIQLVETQP